MDIPDNLVGVFPPELDSGPESDHFGPILNSILTQISSILNSILDPNLRSSAFFACRNIKQLELVAAQPRHAHHQQRPQSFKSHRMTKSFTESVS